MILPSSHSWIPMRNDKIWLMVIVWVFHTHTQKQSFPEMCLKTTQPTTLPASGRVNCPCEFITSIRKTVSSQPNLKQQTHPSCYYGRTSHIADFFVCLSGYWLKQHGFCSWLFWTDLSFCCPANIFAFRHSCSCGLRIIGAFLFLLWHLVSCSFSCVCSWERRLELACFRVGWPTALQASLLMSFPGEENKPPSAWGISCLHFWMGTAYFSLLKLWCLFLCKTTHLLPCCFNSSVCGIGQKRKELASSALNTCH